MNEKRKEDKGWEQNLPIKSCTRGVHRSSEIVTSDVSKHKYLWSIGKDSVVKSPK